MEIIAHDYVLTWNKMLTYITYLVVYIYTMSLIGMLPITDIVYTNWTPNSITIQFLLAPLWLGQTLGSLSYLVILVELATLFSIYWIYQEYVSNLSSKLHAQRDIRISGISSFIVWVLLSLFSGVHNMFWGRHLILIVAQPLLCIAADTYVSSSKLAQEGLEKLNRFKYSHRKV